MDDLPYKKYLVVVIPYSGILSFLYLYAYWGSFNINVLEFISLSDLAKLALFPFVASFISLSLGMIVGQFLTWKVFPPGGGANTPLGRAARKYWYVLILLNMVIILFVLILENEPHRWFTAALLFSLYSVGFTDFKFAIELIPNPSTRGFILFLAVLALGMAFYIGKNEAYLVKTGYGHNLIDVERSKLPIRSDEKNPVSYLGHVSDFFVFYESLTKNIIFVKAKDDTTLFLKPNIKSKN